MMNSWLLSSGRVLNRRFPASLLNWLPNLVCLSNSLDLRMSRKKINLITGEKNFFISREKLGLGANIKMTIRTANRSECFSLKFDRYQNFVAVGVYACLFWPKIAMYLERIYFYNNLLLFLSLLGSFFCGSPGLKVIVMNWIEWNIF